LQASFSNSSFKIAWFKDKLKHGLQL